MVPGEPGGRAGRSSHAQGVARGRPQAVARSWVAASPAAAEQDRGDAGRACVPVPGPRPRRWVPMKPSSLVAGAPTRAAGTSLVLAGVWLVAAPRLEGAPAGAAVEVGEPLSVLGATPESGGPRPPASPAGRMNQSAAAVETTCAAIQWRRGCVGSGVSHLRRRPPTGGGGGARGVDEGGALLRDRGGRPAAVRTGISESIRGARRGDRASALGLMAGAGGSPDASCRLSDRTATASRVATTANCIVRGPPKEPTPTATSSASDARSGVAARPGGPASARGRPRAGLAAHPREPTHYYQTPVTPPPCLVPPLGTPCSPSSRGRSRSAR